MPKEKPMLESPDYLHFKHKFGFLENFTQLYQAFYWSSRQLEKDISFKRCDTFFMQYMKNMGIEHEFEKAVIDPRSFTVRIKTINNQAGIEHKRINAGRLHAHQPEFIPLIAIPGLTAASLTIDGITYSLELEND